MAFASGSSEVGQVLQSCGELVCRLLDIDDVLLVIEALEDPLYVVKLLPFVSRRER